MKRAQQSQIFTIMMGIIVVGGILLFGYSSFTKLADTAKQATSIQFQQDVISKVKVAYGSSFGTVKIKDIHLPTPYTEICFVDMVNVKTSLSKPASSASVLLEKSRYLLMEDSIISDVEANVFLFDENNGFESFYVGEEDKNYILNKQNPVICLNSSSGDIKMRLQSAGNGVKITE